MNECEHAALMRATREVLESVEKDIIAEFYDARFLVDAEVIKEDHHIMHVEAKFDDQASIKYQIYIVTQWRYEKALEEEIRNRREKRITELGIDDEME